MSLKEIINLDLKGYVKYIWPANFCTSCVGTFYSDQFQIDDLENVTFNLGVELTSSGQINLWVKKSNREVTSAIIAVMIDDEEESVETNDWTDCCYILSNFDLSEKAIIGEYAGYGSTYRNFAFIITCEIYWKESIKSNPGNNLYNEIQKFYKSEEISDVTIIVDNFQIPAHKLILCAHSPVFSTMLQSDMKESKEGIITIEDLDSEIILEMLNYCYKGKTKASNNTEVALRLLKVADKYQITNLKEICCATLMNNLSVDNVVNILDAADDYNVGDLRKNAIKFIVLHSKIILASDKFTGLFYAKQDLMLELIRAIGDK